MKWQSNNFFFFRIRNCICMQQVNMKRINGYLARIFLNFSHLLMNTITQLLGRETSDAEIVGVDFLGEFEKKVSSLNGRVTFRSTEVKSIGSRKWTKIGNVKVKILLINFTSHSFNNSLPNCSLRENYYLKLTDWELTITQWLYRLVSPKDSLVSNNVRSVT